MPVSPGTNFTKAEKRHLVLSFAIFLNFPNRKVLISDLDTHFVDFFLGRLDYQAGVSVGMVSIYFVENTQISGECQGRPGEGPHVTITASGPDRAFVFVAAFSTKGNGVVAAIAMKAELRRPGQDNAFISKGMLCDLCDHLGNVLVVEIHRDV